MTVENAAPATEASGPDSVVGQLALAIRIELLKHGYRSQAAFARKMGVTQMWLSERLTGSVQMTVLDLYRIAAGLGVSPQELLPSSAPNGCNDPITHIPLQRTPHTVTGQTRSPISRPPNRSDARRPAPSARRTARVHPI